MGCERAWMNLYVGGRKDWMNWESRKWGSVLGVGMDCLKRWEGVPRVEGVRIGDGGLLVEEVRIELLSASAQTSVQEALL